MPSKTGPDAPKPGEGPSKEERENGLYDLLYVAIAPDGRQVRAAVKGDRDPGYGSTSKMISECAICLLRDTPDVPAGILDAGRCDAAQADQAAGRPCRPDVRGGEVVAATVGWSSPGLTGDPVVRDGVPTRVRGVLDAPPSRGMT